MAMAPAEATATTMTTTEAAPSAALVHASKA